MESLTKDMSKVAVAKPKAKGYTPDPTFHEAIEEITKFVNKYKDVENLEMEFRLGYLETNENDIEYFNSDTSKEFLTKVGNVLQTGKSWVTSDREINNDYFYDGMRLSVDHKGNKTCIKKSKLCTLDFMFEGTPFDIRVCFSKEIPVDVLKFSPKKPTDMYKREKDRMSYKYKSWVYDITSVKTVDNTVEDIKYEIELEVDVKECLKKANSKYLVHSSLLKIADIVGMCENISLEECKLELHKVLEH